MSVELNFDHNVRNQTDFPSDRSDFFNHTISALNRPPQGAIDGFPTGTSERVVATRDLLPDIKVPDLLIGGWQNLSFALYASSYSSSDMDKIMVSAKKVHEEARRAQLEEEFGEHTSASSHIVLSQPLHNRDGGQQYDFAPHLRTAKAKEIFASYHGPHLHAYLDSYGNKGYYVAQTTDEMVAAHHQPWRSSETSDIDPSRLSESHWAAIGHLNTLLHNAAVASFIAHQEVPDLTS
jgi:hypothetical protein